MPITTVIYDLDGTLIDTTGLHEESWKRLSRPDGFKPTGGYECTEQNLIDQKGMAGMLAAKMFLREKYTEELARQLVDEHAQMGATIIRETATLFPNVNQTIQTLQEEGYKIGICTSAMPIFVEATYTALPGLAALVANKTIKAGDYKRGKPFADPIKVAAEMLHSPLEKCLYVGDANSDCLASNAAGTNFVYFCPESKTPEARVLETGAHRIRQHEELLTYLKNK